jgi:hypothetical protein
MICFNISSSDICGKDWGKYDDARSILRMNKVDLDWFRPSVEYKLSDRLRAANFIVRRTAPDRLWAATLIRQVCCIML